MIAIIQLANYFGSNISWPNGPIMDFIHRHFMSFSNPYYWSSHVALWEESTNKPVMGLSLWSSKLQYLHLQKPKRLGLLQKIDAL